MYNEIYGLLLPYAKHQLPPGTWEPSVDTSLLSWGFQLFVVTGSVYTSPSLWCMERPLLFSEPERAFCAGAFHLGLGSGNGAFCCSCHIFTTQTTWWQIQSSPAACEKWCQVSCVEGPAYSSWDMCCDCPQYTDEEIEAWRNESLNQGEYWRRHQMVGDWRLL